PGIPPRILVVALVHTGHRRLLNPLSLGALFLIPATTTLLAWSNESHELIWRGLHVDHLQGLTRSHFTAGGWYSVQNTYLYVVVTATLALLVRAVGAA